MHAALFDRFLSTAAMTEVFGAPALVQGMLDFDFICKRKSPSVAGIIYTFGGQFVSKMCVPSKDFPFLPYNVF